MYKSTRTFLLLELLLCADFFRILGRGASAFFFFFQFVSLLQTIDGACARFYSSVERYTLVVLGLY